MIFVINRLKYDTDKMELISEKCEYTYQYEMLGRKFNSKAKNVKLYRSRFGRWLTVFDTSYSTVGKHIEESEAKTLLITYDLQTYEALFGELEEA